MPAGSYSLRAQIVESLTRFKRPDVPPVVVVRNTLSVALPLAAGLASGHVAAGLGVCVGALCTMFSDQPGPYRQRLRWLLLATLAAALAAWLGFSIGHMQLPLLLATMAFGFAGGMLVLFGPDAARVGMTSIILLVICAATPTTSMTALLSAGLIAAGGLLHTLCALAAWPLQRHRPEREALAALYTGLAALARTLQHDEHADPELTASMTTLQHTLLGRDRAHGRAMEAFVVLLELAERLRLELIAIAALHAADASHARFRDAVARVLDAVAQALAHAEPPQAAEQALTQLQAAIARAPYANPALAMHLRALEGQLAAAVRNANWAGSHGELRAAAEETPLPRALRSGSIIARLRANLSPRSVAFRHAVRTSACLAAALLLERLAGLPHGYWLPMTVAIVLRVDFATTLSFGLLRVLGTLLGLALTTALLTITPDAAWAHFALMVVLCMLYRWLANAHYGIAVVALTGTVVILMSFEGVASGVALSDRALNTVLGSGLAMLAYLLWPTWERGRARAALAEMFDAYAGYLHALVQPEQTVAHLETRTRARLARTNAQASIERLRTEPATPAGLLELARALFANGNRLARTAMALEALEALDAGQPLRQEADSRALIIDCADAVHALASALRDGRPPAMRPDLRQRQRELADAGGNEALAKLCDRLVDNINTLAHVLQRAATP